MGRAPIGRPSPVAKEHVPMARPFVHRTLLASSLSLSLMVFGCGDPETGSLVGRGGDRGHGGAPRAVAARRTRPGGGAGGPGPAPVDPATRAARRGGAPTAAAVAAGGMPGVVAAGGTPGVAAAGAMPVAGAIDPMRACARMLAVAVAGGTPARARTAVDSGAMVAAVRATTAISPDCRRARPPVGSSPGGLAALLPGPSPILRRISRLVAACRMTVSRRRWH